MKRSLTLLGLLTLLTVGSLQSAQAQSYPYYYKQRWYPRQYVYKRVRHTYYYTHYYYRPRSYHHVYYYPRRSRRYVYYYNWRTKRYWGRCDLTTGKYSLLPADKKKETLDEIKESDFPPPVPLEQIDIPGSKDPTDPKKPALKMTKPPPLPKIIDPQP